jgi:hypothetical protein
VYIGSDETGQDYWRDHNHSLYTTPDAPAYVNPWEAAQRTLYDAYDDPFLLEDPSIAAARKVAELYGLDPQTAADWFLQGQTLNYASPTFGGATDIGNMFLRGGWGIENMLRQSGNWDDAAAGGLAQWVDQGQQYLNAQRERDKQQSKARLGQFIGMLGGLALSPFAFGAQLGPLGGALARGATNVIGSAIGGGNPLTALAGSVAGPLGDYVDLPGMFSGLGPMGAKMADAAVRAVGSGALQQIASGQKLDPTRLAMGALPGVVDAGFDSMGGWSGIFGGSPQEAGWTSGYDLPMGNIAPVAEAFMTPAARSFAPAADPFTPAMSSNFFEDPNQQATVMRTAAADPFTPAMSSNFFEDPNLQATVLRTPENEFAYGLFNKEFSPAPGANSTPFVPFMFYEDAPALSDFVGPPLIDPNERLVDELFPAPAERATSENLFTPDADVATPAPAPSPAKGGAWYDVLKPGAILGLAMRIAPMFMDRAETVEADAIVNGEYANENARRQAYLDYANRVFGSIPEVADAYQPRFFSENSNMGRIEIDPETGEIRYVMSDEGRAAVDSMLSAADATISRLLDTDVTALSEAEFAKKVEALREKREADFSKLMRLLYARGMLGVATYGEAGTNLITGRTEAYDLEEGQEANPYLAAYQSAIERENAALAGKSMDDAQDYLDSLLGQSSDAVKQLGARSNSVLDAILGARGRYGANVAAGQARGNALASLLSSPASLFGDRARVEDIVASLAQKPTLDEEERRRLLLMMQGGF